MMRPRIDVGLAITCALAVGACSSSSDAGSTGTPLQIIASAGDGQSGAAGATLQPFTVLVTDSLSGAAESGVSVGWSVTAGGGSLTSASTTTGSDGKASTQLVLGSGATSQQVQAAVSGNRRVSFNATATSLGQTYSVGAYAPRE